MKCKSVSAGDKEEVPLWFNRSILKCKWNGGHLASKWKIGLIEAYWNVNVIRQKEDGSRVAGLIEAYWNVNWGRVGKDRIDRHGV